MYKSQRDREELYEMRDKELEELKETVFPGRRELEDEQERIIKEVKVPSKQAMPRMEETSIKSLKRTAPEVIGNLFDRKDFLSQRIEETKEAMKIRKELHKDIVEEIDEDIKEKQQIESRVADVDEKRNFKMDISILRKEKRHENIQFWRDMLELRTELRELAEKYQTESKIAGLFNELEG